MSNLLRVVRPNIMPPDVTSASNPAPSRPTDWANVGVLHHLTWLAKVAQTTGSAVVITDAQGVTVWVNEGFSRMTGYSFKEAVGCKPGELLQGRDTDRSEVARISAALSSRQSVAAELINYAKNGRRFWIGMKIEPLLTDDGELEGFMAVESDVTNRCEERLSIEQVMNRFEAATRAAGIGVVERDSNGEVVWWSDLMWDIFGVDRDTFKPSRESWLALMHPQDRERMRQNIASLARSPAHYDWEYRIVRPDGEIRHIRSIGASSEEQLENSARFAGITMDITERVQSKQREQSMQQQLLASSHQAGMAEIATGVLHNVGNILNSLGVANTTARRQLKALRIEQLEQVSTLLQQHRATLADFLAQDERGQHLPNYLQALANQISSNSRAVEAELETTDQLIRHLSEVVSAQQELAHVGGRLETIHLHELVETALLVHASDLTQIDILREFVELPPIISDRHKLLQIVVNLLSNAREAIQPDAEERGRILLKLERDDHQVRLSVEDSGIGMTEEVLAKLWTFGFTTKKKGHGFGLHNSANAAHQIGATLTAHSDGPGLGSRFVLSIPIDNPESMLSGESA